MRILKLKNFILFLVLSFLFISQAYGENRSSIPSLDRLYTDNAIVLDIKEKLLSQDYYSQSIAVYLVEKIIYNESFFSIKDELICLLHHLCSVDNTQEQENPQLCLKKRGFDLTGRLGAKTRNTEFGYKLVDILIEQLQYEKDITLVSSAIFALGMIGSNYEGKTIKAIAGAVDTWTLLTRNQDFNLAVLISIEKIAQTNNGIDDPEAYTTLMKIMQSSKDKLIIEKTFEVINTLNSSEY